MTECRKGAHSAAPSTRCTPMTLLIITSQTCIQLYMQMTLCSGPSAQTCTEHKPTLTHACATHGRTVEAKAEYNQDCIHHLLKAIQSRGDSYRSCCRSFVQQVHLVRNTWPKRRHLVEFTLSLMGRYRQRR